MENRKVDDILLANALRVTPCRIFVLGEFLKKGSKTVTELELEKKSKGHFDRVTIYRTLKTFIEADILHRVIGDDQSVKYALCRDHGHKPHNHEHVHFKCNECLTTSCLDELSIAKIELPAGYLKQEVNLLVVGRCPECNKS